MSDPFSYGRSSGAPPQPPPDWQSWQQQPQAMPPPGSLGVMGGPVQQPQAWGSFSQPPSGQQQQQQQQPPPGSAFGGMGGQFNPASIAEMASNPMAQLGMRYGREMVQTSLQRYMPGASGAWNSMRYYFHINNSYVKNKLWKLLFPFASRNFVRVLAAEAGLTGGGGGGMMGDAGGDVAGPAMAGISPYAAPVHDENAPDLYIPVMAFITFVLLAGLLQGTKKSFTPETLVTVTSTSLATTILETVVLRAGLYFISAESCPLLDLLCYSGYKYVMLCLLALAGMLGGSNAFLVAFAYTSVATAFFVVNTLMPVVRPENFRAAHGGGSQLPGGGGRVAAAQKNYFVLLAGAGQFALLWYLGGSARG